MSDIVKDDEALIEELEGQRNLEEGTWQHWMILIIAFMWSLYQLYVVVVPTNSVCDVPDVSNSKNDEFYPLV